MKTTPSTDRHQEFERLYHRTCQKAFNLAYRLVGNRSDAEDVSQDAYTRAWRNWDRYDRTRPFENWLYRIVTNLSYDCLRRKKLERSLSLEEMAHRDSDGEPISLDVPDPGSNPLNSVLAEELEERVEHALEALAPNCRDAIVLAFLEDMPYETIAARMQTPVGTVRSRIFRGRKMLRQRLAV